MRDKGDASYGSSVCLITIDKAEAIGCFSCQGRQLQGDAGRGGTVTNVPCLVDD